MKTNQMMSREVLGVEFEQSTKTEMVNLTKFVKDLKAKVDAGSVKLISDTTKQNILNMRSSKYPSEGELDFLKDFTRLDKFLENEKTINLRAVLLSEVESEEDLVTSKRGKYGGTWVHPLLFVDYLMWISPEFHAAGLKLIYDNVLKYRMLGGDLFKDLNDQIKESLMPAPLWIYANAAKTVGTILQIPCETKGNKVSFMWNEASEAQLEARKLIQEMLIMLISTGAIGNWRQLQTQTDVVARNVQKRLS